jgi:hypothetical protein
VRGTAAVRYSEIPIHPALGQYVQLIWTLDVDEAASFGKAERILPDGIVEAVFHYRTPFAMRYRGAEFDRQPASLVVSQTRRFIESRTRVTYPPQEKNPKGEVHEDIGLISYDRRRNAFVLRQFHKEVS